jgi:intein/homing endonuclease
MTHEQELAYLAAFIDGEGWVTCRQFERKKTSRRIGFTNTDTSLFNAVVRMFERAGFAVSIKLIGTKNQKHSNRWNAQLLGGKEMYQRFKELIPLQHPGKQQRLDAILTEYAYLDENERQRMPHNATPEGTLRRLEALREMNRKRWRGHIPKKPRWRPHTPEQIEKNRLAQRRWRLAKKMASA